MDLWRLGYRSRITIPAHDRAAELDAIFAAAVAFNGSHDITGALYALDDEFGQVLEGPETVIRSLYEKIAADPRHDNVTLDEDTRAEDRRFPGWAMARIGNNGKSEIAQPFAQGLPAPSRQA